MRTITSVELLTVWEQNWDKSVLQRALNLLSVASPELDQNAIAKLSIGERNARLLEVRELMFGTCLKNMTDCPKCSEIIEWETNMREICAQLAQRHDTSGEYNLDVDGYCIQFRLPNSSDISAVIINETETADPKKLLAKCILDMEYNGNRCDIDDLPDEVIQALNRRMEEENPQADIRVVLNCPQCSHQWEAYFDIASYLWTEINWWAERTLQDVHILAKVYGWSEHDILSMSPVRRQFYIDMINL